MKRSIILLCFLVVVTCTGLLAQSRAELKNSFYDAESWILFEAYKDALPLYQQLLSVYPDNANFKYRIGQCYLNMPGEKDKSVKYLEEAAAKIDPKYKEGKFRESGAPGDVLYYLANSYRINNQIDKAIDTYKQFRKNLDTLTYDTVVVDMQIQSCYNAKELMGKPSFIKRYNLGEPINESSSEYDPVMSDDESMLVFARSEPFYDALLYSVKTNGKWSEPVNMNEILKVDRDIFPTSLSSDGKTLYLYSSADYDGIIYSSRFENGTWSPLVKLNDNINTKYWESHATVSHDNNKLYFTSNRKGTYGGLDIYVSKRDSTGDWGPAVNLGPVINSPYNEESPFLSRDDKTLYFSSRGHYNMGGYDIFTSTLQDNGEWSVPENIGYPLNTTDDDVFFKPSLEDYRGFYAIDSPDGFGKQDIYLVELYSDKHPRKFIITGKASVADLLKAYDDTVMISVTDIKKPGQKLVAYTDPKTRQFDLRLPGGDYKMDFEAYGGEKVTRDLNLPHTYESDSFRLSETVLPRTDLKASLYIESPANITVRNGDTVLIPLVAERKSLLTIENWAGNSMKSTEDHQITSPVYTYKLKPSVGENRIVFRLTDRFNNIATEQVLVTRVREMITRPVARPEYDRIIAEKQTAAYIALLKNRADGKISGLISESGVEKKVFVNPDGILYYLKTKAGEKNISPEEVDKTALRVAVMDNVLTQSAVDLIAKNSDGELKNILTGLDIYKAGLKSWTDLINYISEKSNGRVSRKDLDDLVATILAEKDPGIAVIKDKITIYSQNQEQGSAIRESIAAADSANPRLRGLWLRSFYNSSIKHGFTPAQLSEMFAAITTMPGSKAEQLLTDLVAGSEEPLTSSLLSTDLRKEKIRSPEQLMNFILTAGDKSKYPEASVFKTIANLIVSKNIPAESISSYKPAGKAGSMWALWVIIGAALIFFLFIYVRRNRKIKKE